MKKNTAALLLFTLLPFSLFGCADSSTAEPAVADTNSEISDEETAPAIVSEPDFMGYLISGGTNYIDMNLDDIKQATNGEISKESGIEEQSVDTGYLYYTYSLGQKDSMLGGRLKLDQAYDISCSLKCKDNVIKCVSEEITGITKEEAAKICDDFIAAFDGKLPEGYTQFTPSKRGKTYEVGFTKGVDDYVSSMTYRENLDGDYRVTFALQIYSERYGM